LKTRGTKIFFILCTVIVIILTNSSTALAKPQNGYRPQGLFNLQFVLNVSWPGNETSEPISPGETRDVNITISYLVTRGLYGTLLLQLLKGKSFPIQLSIEDKPDWCEAWTLPENMTGVIAPDEVGVQYSSLFIHLNDDAPSNYTLGYVKIRCIAEDKKGPFNIFTLVHGYDNDFTISFITGP
jgi:hypothetical protein